jgi:hypothetical protein
MSSYLVRPSLPESEDAPPSPPAFLVEYDGPPLVETTVGDTDYRVDLGKQGTALGISTRASGSWRWHFAGEVRWDGSSLRSRAFDRPLLDELSKALLEAARDSE